MILTIKRKITLSKSQIKYFNDSLIVFNQLINLMYLNLDNNVVCFDLDILLEKINNKSKIDKFALMDIIIENRNFYYSHSKFKYLSYTKYSLSNSKNNIRVFDNHIQLFGFGDIFLDLTNNNITKSSKLFKVEIYHKNNDFYVCCYFTIKSEEITVDVDKHIGLDYSIDHFYIDSESNTVDFINISKERDKCRRLHSILVKKYKWSNNYKDVLNKIRKENKRIRNKKINFLNKLSNSLIQKYDLISVEDLNLVDIARNNYIDRNGIKHKYGKRIYQSGYYEFVQMLKYKAKIKGKYIIEIPRYFPSSKKCFHCGYINNNLDDVRIREVTCPKCGTTYNRDVNAALNIDKEGYRIYKEIKNNTLDIIK